MPEYIIRYNCWRSFIIYHRIYNRRGSCNKDARYSLLFSFSIFYTSKEINNINKEQIKEELQKFVYFKEDKIIGFIKFKNNITPPVDGYYFKCDFNLKVDGKNALDFSKNLLKEKIDFYDGDVYPKLKKALNVNSFIYNYQ